MKFCRIWDRSAYKQTPDSANSGIIGFVRTWRFVRGSPARRIESMSFAVWKVLRKLPKPAVLLLSLFFLTAIART